MAEVKPEIKLDPADSPGNLADIEEFEEGIEVKLPTSGEEAQGAWLIKVPSEMWKIWNDMYTGENNVEVGKLRVYHQKEGEQNQRVQIRLNNEISAHRFLPAVYNLEMNAIGYNNTVVFSEKDLPGHRAQQPGGGRAYNGSKPSGIQSKDERYGQRKPGTYRTAIPKQTALAPPIVNEAIAKPVEDDAAMDHFARSYAASMNASKKVTVLDKVKKATQPSIANDFTLGSITSKPGKGLKKKPAKEKAVRMGQAELYDALGKCFSRFDYWSLRALRNELHQPESYLKEVLADIAIAMRSGNFAGHYKATEQTKQLLQIESSGQDTIAPDPEPSDQGTGDELGEKDDDDIDFEDVMKMES